jgi:hypothetical protein
MFSYRANAIERLVHMKNDRLAQRFAVVGMAGIQNRLVLRLNDHSLIFKEDVTVAVAFSQSGWVTGSNPSMTSGRGMLANLPVNDKLQSIILKVVGGIYETFWANSPFKTRS